MYYNGTKLLSLNDINGNKPEIYICTSNRNAGKTTFFNRYFVKRFINYGEQFIILYRYKYELDDCAVKFFNDIGSLFFPHSCLDNKSRSKGLYHELLLDGITCGYALALNSSDNIKRYSHIFNNVQRIIFDEFQSESNNYCNKEVSKLISIHTSVARGQNKQVRYVPVFLIGNFVSLLNPYYVELGITEKLNKNAKFLKGNGWVLEQSINDSAKNSLLNSGFNKAFSNNYIDYSAGATYLNDSDNFIDVVKGKSKYIATLKFEDKCYSIRAFDELGIIYCDNTIDNTYPIKIAVTTPDHQINYVMKQTHTVLLNLLRYYFDKGCFRFKDLNCKKAVLKLLSY